MKNKQCYHTHDSVKEEARKYSKRIDFAKHCKPAYTYALRHGIADAICKHMDNPKFGFDKSKSGTLYYLRVCGGKAYKIGITNLTINDRFSKSELDNIHVVATFYFDNGRECYMKEKEIIRNFKQYRYTGAKLLLSGNTSLS